jgi:glucose-6-phosphate-specific signal transduction histidine kinase
MNCGVTSGRRWHPARTFLILASSAVPAYVAIRLRNHYDWEDTDALVALGATCGAAALLAGLSTLAWRRRIDLAIAAAIFAAVLVTPLIVVYYVIRMFATTDYS